MSNRPEQPPFNSLEEAYLDFIGNMMLGAEKIRAEPEAACRASFYAGAACMLRLIHDDRGVAAFAELRAIMK